MQLRLVIYISSQKFQKLENPGELVENIKVAWIEILHKYSTVTS